ncbi:hypothetical protein ACLOJK_015917 [Asimina triloba]
MAVNGFQATLRRGITRVHVHFFCSRVLLRNVPCSAFFPRSAGIEGELLTLTRMLRKITLAERGASYSGARLEG